MNRSKSLILLAICILFAPATRLHASSLWEPIVDAGLVSSTPSPDADLVVVRERFYGAQGVDLTPYGIGTGSDDFVQSIYFRLFPRNSPGQESSVLGTVTFPAGVKILGFITNGGQLGRTTPGGPYTQSDALFAVATNADDYVAPARGFEMPGTGAGSLEFICQIDERSFYFGLDVVGGGSDDFRVIIDYGMSFPPDTTFEVNLSAEKLGGVPSSLGIQTGTSTGVTPGDADFGEISHLMGEPLTTDTPPIAGSSPPVAGRDVIYLLREAPGDTQIDVIDEASGAVIPAMMDVPLPLQQPPRAIAFGADGLLYVLGQQTGLASVDTLTGAVTDIGLPDLPGIYTRMATHPGDPRLFLIRQTNFPDPEDSWVDTYDPATGSFVAAFAAFPSPMLRSPVDLVAGDGRLYLLGTNGEFFEVNIFTGGVNPFALPIPDLPGDDVRAAADPFSGLVYLLRDTTGPTFVDSIDTKTGQFRPAIFTIPASLIPDAGAMLVDNKGMLWVSGKNGGTIGLDPGAPAAPPFLQTGCLDFPGTTNYATIQRSPREVSPAPARPLRVESSAQPGMLTLSWEDLGDPGLVYNLYSGTLDTFYSHAPIGCHLSPAPGPSGSLSFDVPVPAGDVYYLVTASSSAAEGSAGPRPISPTSAACGPAP